ncbi:hypothetical protein Vafri_2917 [Volvox africanus]|uniref:Uncharacterized protein n=1 Tax=Volvox africanus TaxID=51714 RepID=A0A8J4ESB7_9CHLO|nr:hypothetical protein Vafri_2917 [Volvox africanus]
MSSEDQDFAQNLAPFSLTGLSPPDVASLLPPPMLRGPSQHDNIGSQQGLISSSQFPLDSHDLMGAGLLPAPPELVLPPGIQTASMLGGAMPLFPNHSYVLTAPSSRHPSVLKVEHKHSKAARRGPMDEMRQLVRILVKLMPDSSRFLTIPDEGGGGNRVKEEHIKDYLNKVLGRNQDLREDAPPYPDWGLVNGWAAYLSELFTWARGATITPEQALRCARRLPGRSWETLNDELEKLRLCPQAWPLPLRKEAVRDIQKKYEETGQLPPIIPQLSSAMQIATAVGPQILLVDAAAVAAGAMGGGAADLTQLSGLDPQQGAKRQMVNSMTEMAVMQGGQSAVQVTNAQGGQAVYAQVASPFPPHPGAALASAPWAPQPPPKRRKKPSSSGLDLSNLSEYSELELWHLALKVLQEAESKRNTTPANRLGDLQNTHDMVRRVVESFTPSVGGSGAVGALGGQVAMGAPLLSAPGVAPAYHPQVNHQAQAAAAPGQGPAAALVAVAQGPSPSGTSAAGMDAATQLKTRLMVLPQGGLAGAQGGQVMQVLSHGLSGHPLGAGGAAGWSKAPVQQQQQQQQQASGTGPQASAVQSLQLPTLLSSPSGQPQVTASLTTIQQPGAAHPSLSYVGPSASLTPTQQQLPQQSQLVQHQGHQPVQLPQQPHHQQAPTQSQPQPQPQFQPQPQPQAQPLPQAQPQNQNQQPTATTTPSASVATGPSGRQDGAGGVKSTTVSDLPPLKVQAGKELGKEASSKTPGFQKYDVQKLSDKFDNSKFEKGSGGLEALAAAAAELGDRCGADQDELDRRGRMSSPTTAAASPTLAPTHTQGGHQHHNNVRNTAENQPGTRAASGPTSPRLHHLEQRKGDVKIFGRGPFTAVEEMDETPAESAEVDGPTAPQPASSVAMPRSAKELRTRVHLQMDQAAQDVEDGGQQSDPQQQQQQLTQLTQQHASSPQQPQQLPQQRSSQQQLTPAQTQNQPQQQQPSGPSGPVISGLPAGNESVSPTTVAVALPQALSTVQATPPGNSQTLIYHLLPQVDSLTALAHRGIVPVSYPAQLGLGQQIINAGQQYLLVTGQVPSLMTSQVQGQYVIAAAPATATISAGVPIGVSPQAVVQPQVMQQQ